MKLSDVIKPVEKIVITDGVHIVGIEIHHPGKVQELEEKYLELLRVMLHSLDSLYEAHIKADVMNMPDLNIQEVQEALERHIGLTYEEIGELEL